MVYVLGFSVIHEVHETLLNFSGNVEAVWSFGDDPSVVGGVEGLSADRTRLVVDVPLLDAGQAVGVGAGQDDVGLPLQADAALVQGAGVDVREFSSFYL